MKFAHTLLLALAAFTLLATSPAFAQGGETISVPLSDPSQPAHVKAQIIMGSIHVEAYDGKEVLVRAETGLEKVDESGEEKRKDGLRRIRNTGSGMTVEEADNQVKVNVESWNRGVDLHIKVPVRTSLKISTINGGKIEVRGVEGELELGNTNGPITAQDVAGSVVAQTLNGGIKVTLRSVAPGKAMAFSNLNGDIDVTFPASLKADLRMSSNMGEILTDFDIETVATERRSTEGSKGKGFRLKIENEIHAKVGGGGPEITFKNMQGDILIRKGS